MGKKKFYKDVKLTLEISSYTKENLDTAADLIIKNVNLSSIDALINLENVSLEFISSSIFPKN